MRKHSTWLWSIIIVVVIFAFVIWGTNTGHQAGGPGGPVARINGEAVSEEDLLSAKKEVLLGFYLRNGRMPGTEAEQRGFNLERETYQTLLLIQKIKEQQIHAGTEAKAAVAAGILRSLQSEGINTLAELEQTMLSKEGFSLADLDRYVGHQISLQQLVSLEGLSGQLITPQQLESLWIRENQELSAQVVFFSASNYLQSVEVTPEALGSYFTNQMAFYRIPERIQVAYVAYPISNYLSEAEERFVAITNLNEQLDTVYRQRGTNFYADLTPDQARERILEEEKRKVAIMSARQAAAAFADELWRQEPMKPDDLHTLGAQKGLVVEVTEPFDRTATPEELKVNAAFAQAAFQLREDEPFAGPLQGEENVYVITMFKRIPSENAQFEEVKARVTEDYRLQQATLKARELGRAFAEQLTNSLATGKSFTEICSAAGYQPELLPDFSQNTRSLEAVEAHTSLAQFMQVAFSTPERTASGFNFTRDGGYIVYVGSKLPVDEMAMKAELPRFAQFVRQSLQSEAFNQWFNQEAAVGLRETPLNRTPPAELNAPVN